MSANVETMFFVSNEENARFVPWHGLGTPVVEAPNSAEAIKLAGIDWTVDSKPIFDYLGNEIPGYKSDMRSSDNTILGVVSDRYKIVQNSEAFEFTDALIGEGVVYETAGSLRNGKQTWLLARMPQQSILGDAVDPYICFSNTFDGSGSIKVCMTPIRVVCNNTLNMALNSATRSWATKHMGDMSSKLEEARNTLGLATAYMNKLAEEAEKLSEVKVEDSKVEYIVTSLFPIDFEKDSNRKINNMQSMRDAFMRCYGAEDIKQFNGTAWGVINAASDFVGHTSPARESSKFDKSRWGKIMFGHPILDFVTNSVAA